MGTDPELDLRRGFPNVSGPHATINAALEDDLSRKQGMSWSWALQYEGWSIDPATTSSQEEA